jgi:hypothetical protein
MRIMLLVSETSNAQYCTCDCFSSSPSSAEPVTWLGTPFGKSMHSRVDKKGKSTRQVCSNAFSPLWDCDLSILLTVVTPAARRATIAERRIRVVPSGRNLLVHDSVSKRIFSTYFVNRLTLSRLSAAVIVDFENQFEGSLIDPCVNPKQCHRRLGWRRPILSR